MILIQLTLARTRCHDKALGRPASSFPKMRSDTNNSKSETLPGGHFVAFISEKPVAGRDGLPCFLIVEY